MVPWWVADSGFYGIQPPPNINNVRRQRIHLFLEKQAAAASDIQRWVRALWKRRRLRSILNDYRRLRQLKAVVIQVILVGAAAPQHRRHFLPDVFFGGFPIIFFGFVAFIAATSASVARSSQPH